MGYLMKETLGLGQRPDVVSHRIAFLWKCKKARGCSVCADIPSEGKLTIYTER